MAKKKIIKKKNIKKKSVNTEKIIIDEELELKGISKIIRENKLLSYTILSFVIIMTSFSLYYKTIDYEIVYCDDNIFLNDYKSFNQKFDYLENFQRTFGTSYYRPILGMSLVWDAWLGDTFYKVDKDGNSIGKGVTDPRPFQLTNNVLHSVGSVLVFFFLITLRYNPLACFLFAMLFAVHPILTPAASWISGRNDSLITLFVLLSFLSVIGYYQVKDQGLKILMFIIHMFLFAISFFTKEIGVFFPVVIVAYNAFYRENMLLRTGTSIKLNTKRFFANENLALAVGWTLVFVMWWSMRKHALAVNNIFNNPDNLGFDAFIANLKTTPAMLGKIFLPIKMIALSTFESFSVFTGIVVILTIGILGFNVENVRKRNILFGFSWFALFLIPTLFVRIYLVDDFFDYAEHRAYLIMAGIFVIVLEILRGLKINYNKPTTLIAFAIIFSLFLIKSNSYKKEFDGRKNFWSHMTEMYPYKSRGYLDLGKAYLANNELTEADSLYRLGIERNPDNLNFYIDLASLELRRNQPKKSEQYSKKALAISNQREKDRGLPENKFLPYLFLADSQFKQGKFKEATKSYQQTIKYKKGQTAQIIHKLAISLHNSGNYSEAVNYYKVASQRSPKDVTIISNMGLAMHKGKVGSPEQTLLKAKSISDKAPIANKNLLIYYAETGQVKKLLNVYNDIVNKKIKVEKNVLNSVKSVLKKAGAF